MREEVTRGRVPNSAAWLLLLVVLLFGGLFVSPAAKADLFTRTKVVRRFGTDRKIDVAIDGRAQFWMRFYIVNQMDPSAQDRQGVAPYDCAIDIDAQAGKNPEVRGGRKEEFKDKVLSWRKLFQGEGPGYDGRVRLQAENKRNQAKLKKDLQKEGRSDRFVKRNVFTGILKGRIEPSEFVPGDTLRIEYAADQDQDDNYIDVVIAPYTLAQMLGIQQEMTTLGLLQGGNPMLGSQALLPTNVPLSAATQWDPGSLPHPQGVQTPNNVGPDARFRRDGGAFDGTAYRPGQRNSFPSGGPAPSGNYGGQTPHHVPPAPYTGAPLYGSGTMVPPSPPPASTPTEPPPGDPRPNVEIAPPAAPRAASGRGIDLDEEERFERGSSRRPESAPVPMGQSAGDNDLRPVGTKTGTLATLEFQFVLRSGSFTEYSFKIGVVGYHPATGKPVDFTPGPNGQVLPKVFQVVGGKAQYAAQPGLIYVPYFTGTVQKEWELPPDKRDGMFNEGRSPGWVVPEGGRRLVLTRRN